MLVFPAFALPILLNFNILGTLFGFPLNKCPFFDGQSNPYPVFFLFDGFARRIRNNNLTKKFGRIGFGCTFDSSNKKVRQSD